MQPGHSAVEQVPDAPAAAGAALTLEVAAALPVAVVLERLVTSERGLTRPEADRRRAAGGANAVRSHHAGLAAVALRQVRSPLLALLAATAAVSFAVGQRTDAAVIAVILSVSVGLGIVNEYRAEQAAQALHETMRHVVVVRRDGVAATCDVTELVPGDVVELGLGSVVPADVRLLRTDRLSSDESMLTGESVARVKDAAPVAAGTPVTDADSCALMGTVVVSGTGLAVVVATGARAVFGRIALGLGERHGETEFQAGLRHFSGLLARIALVLSAGILVINLVLARPFIDAVLFSLAIAVGITPQLLPAVVTASLATGAKRLAAHRVLVKRLVCIEDLGNIELLLTDKTGTLTDGHITYRAALAPDGTPDDAVRALAMWCNEASTATDGTVVAANPLDAALHAASGRAPAPGTVVDRLAFDHERRLSSALVDGIGPQRLLVVKGAPEQVLARCPAAPAQAAATLDALLHDGERVVAVATRALPGRDRVGAGDESELELAGFVAFVDAPKASAGPSVQRLLELGITTRVVTGDHPVVAQHVLAALGIAGGGSITGVELDALDDAALTARLADTVVFARVSPEQKARIVRAYRSTGIDVAYLGDGVNDALALHAADVGISVDDASEVARDAADVVLLEKDLAVLADGVLEGRRTFANTIKYVLMGTSSNFGNMFSAAAASAFLPFLPMLPSQILLNNLLYDASQLAIPTDRVDQEQTARPQHWDLHAIERFMLFFGPISSMFDFITFAVLLKVLRAGASEFHSGWFVESLATQTLVLFVIRTRRVPFWRSSPGRLLTVGALGVVVVGAALPFSPLSKELGFTPLPLRFFVVLGAMVVSYLLLVETAKRRFFASTPGPGPRVERPHRRVHRRAARFSSGPQRLRTDRKR